MKNWHEMTPEERMAETAALFAKMDEPGWKPPEPFRPSRAMHAPGPFGERLATPRYAQWVEDAPESRKPVG
jgi:hypothetical protein